MKQLIRVFLILFIINPLPIVVSSTFEQDLKTFIVHYEGHLNKIYVIERLLHGGIGHKLTKKERVDWKNGNPVSEVTVEDWYTRDIGHAKETCHKYIYNFSDLSEVRQICLISLAFQLGPTHFSKFRKMIAYTEKEKWSQAAEEIVDSKAGRDPLIAKRFQQTAAMFRNNEFLYIETLKKNGSK